MIKIGQIGMGHNHGAAKMQTFRKFPELFEIVGIAPESDEWLEKRGGLPAYEGLPILTEEALLARCDAVLVETEIPLLTATAQKCVDAGKHILMDKPASGTLAEFRKLLDTAKEKGLVVQLGYMYRYNPAVLQALEKLENGTLGRIYSINAEMSACDPLKYRQWLDSFPGGGMYIFGSHMLDLVIRFMGKPEKIMEDEAFFDFLKTRKGLLDGVCVSGGEPTLQPELENLLREIKNLGFAVKLDTNGSHPHMLKHLVRENLIDYVAMDIKNCPDRYAETIGLSQMPAEIEESIRFLMAGEVDYEFRTTVVLPLHSEESISGMARWLLSLSGGQKAKQLFLQPFVDRDTVPVAGLSAPDEKKLAKFGEILASCTEVVSVRGVK